MRRSLKVAAGLVFLVVAVIVAIQVLPAYGKLDGAALGSSLARHLEGSSFDPCELLEPREWRCDIATHDESQIDRWWLRVEGDCWTASVSADLSPPYTKGCVRLRDQVLGS